MKTRLSGLLDGELERHDTPALFEALRSDSELRGCWREYLLISDALKDERIDARMLDTDITARVMASLQDEPVVLAPHASMRSGWQRPALALAATVAGVAVVAWMALAPQNNQLSLPGQTLAQREPAAIKPVRQASRDMREYLAAHQAQSSGLQFRGGTENIRTISTTGIAAPK